MYFFTDFFRTQLQASQTIMDTASVRVALFRRAPHLAFPQNVWLTARTVAELTAMTGWKEVAIIGYPLSTYISTSGRVLGGSKYVMFSEYPFSSLSGPVEVEALGLVYNGTLGGVVNPLIFVTTTPVGPNLTPVYPGDSLTANPDAAFPDQTNRWMFSWATSHPDPIEGPLQFFRAPPTFEVSGSQHVWLYPQRANMIANPSFELPGTGFWSANGTFARVSGGAAGAWAGQTTGASGLCIMESNEFPTRLGLLDSEQWTVQVSLKGDGPCKVGLVSWDADYRQTMVDWGEETWNLSTSSWTHAAVHRSGPEAHIAMVRIECQGSSLTVDQVLAERGFLKDWLYFDGDEKYGARDDFSWYGGVNRQGASYSLWYNNRKAVSGRLFAQNVDPNDPTANVTDEDMENQGLVYRWVPAGITVFAHMDVFYPHDLQRPVPAKSVGVLPYRTADPMGVASPWS